MRELEREKLVLNSLENNHKYATRPWFARTHRQSKLRFHSQDILGVQAR